MSEFLPPLVLEIMAKNGALKAGLAEADAEVQGFGSRSSTAFSKLAGIGKTALKGITVGAVGVGVASVKMAGDFQEAMTSMVTGAGESEQNLKSVGAGVLAMARATGESTKQLTDGLYMVESAGYHGADSLKVLKAAAEGAKVGGAQLGDVANAVTSALNAYALKGKDATGVTNALVATVSAGKMHMQDLAGSLGAVLPTAAAMNVGIGELGGAMSTMTAQGIDAARGATSLRFLLSALGSPTNAASKAMMAMGVNSVQLGNTLTHHGLVAALTMLTDKVHKDIPEGGARYLQALSGMVGGTRGMQAVLSLTGSHLDKFKANVASVGDASHKTSGDVTGWAKVQADFNTKLERAKQWVETLAIRLGTWLIPKIEEAAKVTATVVGWFEKHRVAADALGVVVGTVLTAAIAAYITKVVEAQIASVKSFATMIADAATWAATTTAAVITTATEWAIQMGIMDASAVASAGAMLVAWAPIILGLAAIGIAAYELYKHWGAIWDGIKSIAQTVWDFLKRYGEWIVAGFLGPVGIAALELYKHWDTVWSDVKHVAEAAWHFLDGSVLQPIERGFTALWHGLETVGNDIIDALKKWGPLALAALVPFIGIPLLILTHFSAIKGFMTRVWDDAVGAIKAGIDDALRLIRALPGEIVRALGNLGSLLIHAGEDVVGGFVHGIESKFDSVKNTLSSLTHKLTSWKGPPEVDRMILHGSGQMVIDGFINGLESRYGDVRASLRGLTSSLATTVLTAIGRGVTPTSALSTADLVNRYASRRGTAVSTAQDAKIATAHYSELSEHADALTKRLANLTDADTKAEQAARKHAQTLADAARAAGAHGKALADLAHAATENATAMVTADNNKQASLRKLVAAAKTGAEDAKKVADAATAAAKAASSAAIQAGKDLLTSVTDSVTAMQSEIKGFTDSLASALTGDDSIATLWSTLTQAGDASVATLQGQLDDVLANTQQFATDLQSLAADGATQDLIAQIAQMGPQAGDALAQQLLAAGSGAIAALTTTMTAISSYATGAAQRLALAFYGPGVTAMQQFIAGLQSQFPELQAALAPLVAQVATLGASAPPAPPAGTLPHFATGVQNFAGGLALVGERGPEIVSLPGGSSVTPNDKLGGVSIAAGAIAPGAVIVHVANGDPVTVKSATQDAVNAAFERLVREIRSGRIR